MCRVVQCQIPREIWSEWRQSVLSPVTNRKAEKTAEMGKKDNARAQQKKAERKAMEEKMNRMVANVKVANSVDDPLALLPKPFTVYNKNGLELTLETVRAPELPESDKVRIEHAAGRVYPDL